jgi:hypothetical protein
MLKDAVAWKSHEKYDCGSEKQEQEAGNGDVSNETYRRNSRPGLPFTPTGLAYAIEAHKESIGQYWLSVSGESSRLALRTAMSSSRSSSCVHEESRSLMRNATRFDLSRVESECLLGERISVRRATTQVLDRPA